MVEGYKRVLATLYSPANYFQRCALLLRRLPRRSRSGRPVSWSGIRALLRSLVRQTFSAYGWHYLRLLAGAALRRPSLFPDAVAYAIKGHHLFTITAEILKADAFSRRLGVTRESYQPQVAAALNAGQAGVAASLERRILRLLEQAQRDYQSFRRDAQDTVREVLDDFAAACSTWVHSLRLARARAGQLRSGGPRAFQAFKLSLFGAGRGAALLDLHPQQQHDTRQEEQDQAQHRRAAGAEQGRGPGEHQRPHQRGELLHDPEQTEELPAPGRRDHGWRTGCGSAPGCRPARRPPARPGTRSPAPNPGGSA